MRPEGRRGSLGRSQEKVRAEEEVTAWLVSWLRGLARGLTFVCAAGLAAHWNGRAAPTMATLIGICAWFGWER